jgi:hypothetical protein
MKQNKTDWLESIKIRKQLKEDEPIKPTNTKKSRIIKIKLDEIRIIELNNKSYQDLIDSNLIKINKLKQEIKEVQNGKSK